MDVELNGARIHYERSGSGFPLLLIHAGIADSRMWEPQAEAFANHFDMVRPDLRGFGDSELPPGPYSMVADLIALLDHLKIDRAHVVGCSMGGTVAIDLALKQPKRVKKLVLVASGVSGSNLGAADAALFADVEAADKADDMDAVNRAEVRLWVDGPRRPEGSAPAAVRELVLDMNGRSLHTDWTSAESQSLDPPAITRLSEIGAPTLVIVGDQDLPHASANAELITSNVAGSRTVVIKDAAHLPSLERPEEFNLVVLDFLAS
ncbi:MAG TPA: alpha/beta fold hydrolase [Candidatus Dormibacteraeota bacterium]|nr:alpha/beta fold hydrolase [Candidatus Dormibacteraeota bacterium]